MAKWCVEAVGVAPDGTCRPSRCAYLISRHLSFCVGLPSPAQLLHLERARLFGQLDVRDCQPVLALLEAGMGSPRCWLTAAMAGIKWISSLCPRALPPDWQEHPLPDAVLTWIRGTGGRFGCQDEQHVELLLPEATPQPVVMSSLCIVRRLLPNTSCPSCCRQFHTTSHATSP